MALLGVVFRVEGEPYPRRLLADGPAPSGDPRDMPLRRFPGKTVGDWLREHPGWVFVRTEPVEPPRPRQEDAPQ